MNQPTTITILSQLFQNHFSESPKSILALPESGSNRKYYRIHSSNYTAIGAYNNDIKENEAFFSFTQTFLSLKLNVPSIYKIDEDQKHYLIRDLGNKALFDSIQAYQREETEEYPLCCIKKSIEMLIDFQVLGAKHIDFSKCYPREKFDAQSVQWDLNYFKYNFLKLTSIPFDESLLENDFQTIIELLEKAPSDYFMFRDFQSRNIMISEDKPWFIDYQGGRKGALQYDLASILYSPKSHLNKIQRESLLSYYIESIKKKIDLDENEFVAQYYGFVLVRILQALGAYGYRGIFEKKQNFINSIPKALSNLQFIFDEKLSIDLPEIKRITNILAESKWAKPYQPDAKKLTVRITSFSYKKGIPEDPSSNGGGFAFDCRGLPNPGRLEEYKKLSGLDQSVINYLEEHNEVEEFQKAAQKLVGISVEEYLKRGFNHLCINFGCTGGQHRSVYNAERMFHWLKNNYSVELVITHTEQKNWPKNE